MSVFPLYFCPFSVLILHPAIFLFYNILMSTVIQVRNVSESAGVNDNFPSFCRSMMSTLPVRRMCSLTLEKRCWNTPLKVGRDPIPTTFHDFLILVFFLYIVNEFGYLTVRLYID